MNAQQTAPLAVSFAKIIVETNKIRVSATVNLLYDILNYQTRKVNATM